MRKDYTKDEYSVMKGLNETELAETSKSSQNLAPMSNAHIGLVMTVCVFLLILSLLVCGISNLVNTLRQRREEVKTQVVLEIDGEIIDEDFFRLFVGRAKENVDLDGLGNEEKSLALKKAAKDYASEMICLVHTAVDKGFSLSEENRKNIIQKLKADVKPYALMARKTEEQYYKDEFGVEISTAAKYVEYFNVSDSLLDSVVSTFPEDEMLSLAYEKYKTKFASADITMIYFDMSNMDSGVNGFTLSKAQTVYEELTQEVNGIRVVSSEYEFAKAINQWTDKNDLYPPGEMMDGKVHVDGTLAEKYPVLFETTCEMSISEARLIVDKEACYIVRVDSQKLFETCKNDDELHSLALQMFLDEHFDPIKAQEKFIPIEKEGYDLLDALSMVR